VGEAHLTYTVVFPSVGAADAAEARLAKAGFAVSKSGATPPISLEASIVGEEDQADKALDEALVGIEHDPEIIWQAASLTEIFRPQPGH
jgi:hypothetical protein